MPEHAPPRLAMLADYPEEGWLAMNHTAEHLAAHWRGPIAADVLVPSYSKILERIPRIGSHRKAFNADRFINRFLRYPRFLRSIRDSYDLFHVIDHSYAHLVHSLPAERTGVCCHDLDAFASVLTPNRERRPRWYRRMAKHLLEGLEKAAAIFAVSHQTRTLLLEHGVAPPERIVYAPLGLGAEYTLNRPAGQQPPQFLEALKDQPWMLHVGSCVPRKRVDVLLEVFAAVRRDLPGLKLVKVSGQFARQHLELIGRHKLQADIVHVHGLSYAELAEVYRQSPLTLIPSEAEGWGWPATEAGACGSRVIASDIPALREAGGPVPHYCPVGNVDAWAAAVLDAFQHPERWPGPEVRAAHASQFSWANTVETMVRGYQSLLARGVPQ